LLLTAASSGFVDSALARNPFIAISRTTLSEAIAALSAQTGISVGIEGNLPFVMVKPVKGEMSPEAALRRILQGTGLTAVRVGPQRYRLVRSAKVPSPTTAPEQNSSPQYMQDIIVTANKRDENLLDIPLSLSVVSFARGSSMRGVIGTTDIANRIEGLSLTNVGPGHNRQFIRGVADSPFNGPSQSTVSVQIDDIRATYNAPDPDLALVDVERVEVLKGPQGPLYGTGALGGVYHIVTRRPDLERSSGFVAAEGGLINDGDYGFGGQAMLNLPLADARLGIRAVGYTSKEPGWIDTPAGHDRNYMTMMGGRLALRAVPAENWTVDVTGAVQWLHVDDSQYVFSRQSRFRPSNVSEPQDNDFRMINATARGTLGGVNLLASMGLVDHEVTSGLDASASASALGVSGPAFVNEERRYHVFDSEFRLSSAASVPLQWLAGLSYLVADNRQNSEIFGSGGGIAQPLLSWRQQVSEWAVFGELSIPLLPRLRGIAGGRLFHWTIENEAGVSIATAATTRHKTGITPSLALQWRPDGHNMIFARYATAFRPGGLSPTGGTGSSYDSDELTNVEIGARLSSLRHFALSATLYHTRWLHIQSDTLLANGLVSTRNAGNGDIDGADVSLEWKTNRWTLEGGAQIQHARLTTAFPGTVSGDARLPVVPDISARLAAAYRLSVGHWQSEIRLGARYNGSARLSLDPGLDRKMGDYATVELSFSLTNGLWAFAANAANILDSRADSFAFGNPFSIRSITQFTPLRPRVIRIILSRNW
jgi:outer membrane receptor protein involved in Fe transport